MVHFLQFVHLFCCSSSTIFLKPENGGSILALNHNVFVLPKVQQVRPKGPPFGFFSALCDFFRKFSKIIKGYPLHFLKFSVCKKRLMGLTDLFLGFSALCDFNRKLFKNIYIFSNASNSCFRLSETFFRKFFKCLQRVPLHFFLFFQRNGCSKTLKCPLLHLSALCDLPRTKKNQKNFKKKFFFLFFPHVGFVEENT